MYKMGDNSRIEFVVMYKMGDNSRSEFAPSAARLLRAQLGLLRAQRGLLADGPKALVYYTTRNYMNICTLYGVYLNFHTLTTSYR
jgi:hypothetical protein